MKYLSRILPVAIFALACCARPAAAQADYEIQVYGAETVDPGHTMVELHSNYMLEGSKTMEDGLYPTNHALHETIETTHGFTDWFEAGFLNFHVGALGAGMAMGGRSHSSALSRSRKMALASGSKPLSNEIGYQRRAFSVDTWTWEIRPIVDQKYGRWHWAINPALDGSFHGQSVHLGMVFWPKFKFSYDFSAKIAGGLEYYGSVDPVTGFFAIPQQQHQVFPPST